MAKKKEKTLEEKLQEALVPENQWPYMLPENWCWVKLNKLYHVNPKNIVEDDSVDAAFIPMANIEPNFIGKYKFEVDSWNKVRKGHTQFADGDVTFAKISPCFENGKAFIAENLPNGIGAGTTELIVLRNRKIVPKYTFYLISTEKFVNGGRRTYSGVVGQQRISMDYVNQFPIPFPPLPEQKRIVHRIESLFAKLDEAKEKIQQVLDGAEMRKAAILHKAFTGELTKNWRKGNGISEDSWEVKKLKDITTPKAGFAFNSKKFTSEGYQIIRMGNLYGGKLDLDRVPVFYAPENIDEKIKKRAMLHDNDIVITLTGTKYKRDYGYAVLIKEPVNLFLNQRILALSPIEKIVNPTFLLYSLRSKDFRDIFFSNETGGVNQGNVSSKFVENIKIKIPLLEEQREIVKVLNHQLEFVDDTTKICKDAYEQIDTMKKSILAKAFRGELGTNNPTEDSALNLLKEVLQYKF